MLFLFLALLSAMAIGAYLLYKDNNPPSINVSPSGGTISPQTPLSIEAVDMDSGIKRVSIYAVEGLKMYHLASYDFADRPPRVKIDFNLASLWLPHGAFQLEIEAQDASLARFGQANSNRVTVGYLLDTTPPDITLLGDPPEVTQGGTGCLVYKLSEPAITTGVMVGDRFFPGYAQADGQFLCFFAFPLGVAPDQYHPMLTASDSFGNRSQIPVPVKAIPRAFRQDSFNITEEFLNKNLAQFQDQLPPELNPIQKFLVVNRTYREQSAQELRSLGFRTESSILWKGPFVKAPDAAITATFGDHRTYLAGGNVIDEKNHEGIDLASVKHGRVVAANSGKVIFTGTMNIYGQMVVIDHGLGVQSLYAHLSAVEVNPGDSVQKSQLIGKTGTSGLASGDHLHLGILLSGVPVSPEEWLSPGWYQNHIVDRLN